MCIENISGIQLILIQKVIASIIIHIWIISCSRQLSVKSIFISKVVKGLLDSYSQ